MCACLYIHIYTCRFPKIATPETIASMCMRAPDENFVYPIFIHCHQVIPLLFDAKRTTNNMTTEECTVFCVFGKVVLIGMIQVDEIYVQIGFMRFHWNDTQKKQLYENRKYPETSFLIKSRIYSYAIFGSAWHLIRYNCPSIRLLCWAEIIFHTSSKRR